MKTLMLVVCGAFLGCGAVPPECSCEPPECPCEELECNCDSLECNCEDIEGCFEETKPNFFETYYAGCMENCVTCEKWALNCGYNYDVTFCIMDHWDRGYANTACAEDKEWIDELYTLNLCGTEDDWVCLAFQE